MEANSQAMSELKNREAAEKHRIDMEIAAAKASAEKLEGKTVRLTAKAGANGKLFGSVTPKISEALMAQFGLDVGKQKIVLDEPIKAFGTYPVEVKLYNGISAAMFVMVGE